MALISRAIFSGYLLDGLLVASGRYQFTSDVTVSVPRLLLSSNSNSSLYSLYYGTRFRLCEYLNMRLRYLRPNLMWMGMYPPVGGRFPPYTVSRSNSSAAIMTSTTRTSAVSCGYASSASSTTQPLLPPAHLLPLPLPPTARVSIGIS